MENQHLKILLVDDEPDIIEFLSFNLRKEGFSVYTATNGAEALQVAQQIIPNLIVLDIMMPEPDGFAVARLLRAKTEFNDTIICFLTARSEDRSQITALDIGGDDYITKPIRIKVFISRIYALLRRLQPDDGINNKVIVLGDLTLDTEKILAFKNEVAIELARKEFEILQLLASRPGKVFTREEIYKKIWGSNVIVGNRTIDVHIRKLREKVGEDVIKTAKGIGYKLDT
ncbi:MAG: response regulator transcription factor [Saprospiraceae bacterium]|nr:response regulator transcription factor [Saprospiraceae bacterium]